MFTPVLVPLDVTLPLKVIVLVLEPAMVTAFAPLAWEMLPPQVTVPLVPLTLNVAPLAPASPPAAAPHVPVTPLRFTPFVPPVEVTLANVPLTAPVVRFSAVAPETLTVLLPTASVPKVDPLMAVVEPVNVMPLKVT